MRDVRLHDGRHTAATLLLSEGVHPCVVMEVLGHARMRPTTDNYTHVMPPSAATPSTGRATRLFPVLVKGPAEMGCSRCRPGGAGEQDTSAVVGSVPVAAAGALDGFLLALTDAMVVDETLSNGTILEMAYDLRSLRPGGITFLTAPVAGTGWEGQQSVVYLQQERAAQLWEYLRADSVQAHAQEFALDTLPAVPN